MAHPDSATKMERLHNVDYGVPAVKIITGEAIELTFSALRKQFFCLRLLVFPDKGGKMANMWLQSSCRKCPVPTVLHGYSRKKL